MLQRLQKCISEAGVASRRAAEQMIADGRVTVNGVPAAIGQSADPETDEIRIDGRLLPKREQSVYLMLHKPRGYVTTLSDEQGRRTVAELVRDAGVRVYPVGQLDLDSEGLLLMTNDGAFANAVMHPSHAVDKVYHVTVSGAPLEQAAEAMRAMTELDGEPIAPPTWDHPGLHGMGAYEVPHTNEDWWHRPPTPIRLKKGWNHVCLDVPAPRHTHNKWVATFTPVLGDTAHPREVPGLEYADEAP